MNNEKTSPKSRNKEPSIGRAFLFLLIIPVQLVLDMLIIYVGSRIDMAFVSSGPDAVGHAAPIFSGLGLILSVILTIAAIILSLVLTIVHLVKARRNIE